MKKKLIYVLTLGVLVRLFLAATTFHQDIRVFYYGGSLINQGNILNLYDYILSLAPDNPILNVYGDDLFIYPPVVYLYFSLPSVLVNLIVDPQTLQKFLLTPGELLGHPVLGKILLAFKTPYIFFDIAIAFLLQGLFKETRKKFLVFSLWMFNPISLFATYMMGQFDIIPTFFVMLVLYFVNKSKPTDNLYKESFLLGLGGALKIYPLLFLVPLSSLKKSWLERIKIILVGVTPYLLTLLPYINSKGYRTTALLAGLTTKSFYPQIPVSGGQSIILFISLVVFFYLLFLRKSFSVTSLWKTFFILLLLFFVFTHYHPQWFLWITPFFLIHLVKSNFKNWMSAMLILISFLGALLLFDPGLNVQIFAPLIPMLSNQSSILEVLGRTADLNFYRSLFHSLFVGVALFSLYSLMKKPKGNK